MGISSYGGSSKYSGMITGLDTVSGQYNSSGSDEVLTFSKPSLYIEIINRDKSGQAVRINFNGATGGSTDIVLNPDPNNNGNGEYTGIAGCFTSFHVQGGAFEVRVWH